MSRFTFIRTSTYYGLVTSLPAMGIIVVLIIFTAWNVGVLARIDKASQCLVMTLEAMPDAE